MADIFLSYNREDQSVARQYADAFEAADFTVWWDVTLRSGDSYDVVTENALRNAKAVVVLWSKRSVASRWVRAEATIADRCGTMMPVMIEDCERPIMFELVQSTDLTHWNGERTDHAWLSFLDDLRRFIESGGKDRGSIADADKSSKQPQEPTTAAAARKRAIGHRSAFAILPFTFRSSDPDDEEFAEMLGEDLTAAASHTYGMRLLSHDAMAKYRDQKIDARQLGREHGLDYVVDGKIRKLGKKLRIGLQLLDAHNGNILDTFKLDHATEDMFDDVDTIVEELNAHLYVVITRIELERASKLHKSETAWDALKRCFAQIPRMSIPSLEKAVRHARRAVELAPDYPLAVSSLGLILGLLYQRDGSRKPELLEEALEHTAKALQLAPRHYVVLNYASLVKYYAQEWIESLRLAEAAVDVNPMSVDAMHSLGGALNRVARYEEAIEWLDKADHLAPRGYMITISLINRCWSLYGMGRYEEGVAIAEKMLRIMPSDHNGLMIRPIFYAELGDWESARNGMLELRKSYPEEPLELYLGTIRASRQTDAKRERNAELFEKIWHMVEAEAPGNLVAADSEG